MRDVEVKDGPATELEVKLKSLTPSLSLLAATFSNSTHRQPLDMVEPESVYHIRAVA